MINRACTVNKFCILINPVSVIFAYVIIFYISYIFLLERTLGVLDYIFIVISVIYTLYYAPMVYICLRLQGLVKKDKVCHHIDFAIYILTADILLNIILNSVNCALYTCSAYQVFNLLLKIFGFFIFAYILWKVAGLLVQGEGYMGDRYRQFGAALLLYFNIVGAFVIWKRLKLVFYKQS